MPLLPVSGVVHGQGRNFITMELDSLWNCLQVYGGPGGNWGLHSLKSQPQRVTITVPQYFRMVGPCVSAYARIPYWYEVTCTATSFDGEARRGDRSVVTSHR